MKSKMLISILMTVSVAAGSLAMGEEAVTEAEPETKVVIDGFRGYEWGSTYASTFSDNISSEMELGEEYQTFTAKDFTEELEGVVASGFSFDGSIAGYDAETVFCFSTDNTAYLEGGIYNISAPTAEMKKDLYQKYDTVYGSIHAFDVKGSEEDVYTNISVWYDADKNMIMIAEMKEQDNLRIVYAKSGTNFYATFTTTAAECSSIDFNAPVIDPNNYEGM